MQMKPHVIAVIFLGLVCVLGYIEAASTLRPWRYNRRSLYRSYTKPSRTRLSPSPTKYPTPRTSHRQLDLFPKRETTTDINFDKLLGDLLQEYTTPAIRYPWETLNRQKPTTDFWNALYNRYTKKQTNPIWDIWNPKEKYTFPKLLSTPAPIDVWNNINNDENNIYHSTDNSGSSTNIYPFISIPFVAFLIILGVVIRCLRLRHLSRRVYCRLITVETCTRTDTDPSSGEPVYSLPDPPPYEPRPVDVCQDDSPPPYEACTEQYQDATDQSRPQPEHTDPEAVVAQADEKDGRDTINLL